MFTNSDSSKEILSDAHSENRVFGDKNPMDLNLYPNSLSDMFFTDIYRSLAEDHVIYLDARDNRIQLTFGELKRQALTLAAGFKKEYDLRPRDVIAVCAPDNIHYPALFLTALATGCIFAPMRYSSYSTPDEIENDLATLQPKVLVLHHTELEIALPAAKKAKVPESRIVMFPDPSSTQLRSLDAILHSHEPISELYQYTQEEFLEAPCYLCFTSGSTGKRKAVKVGQTMLASLILYSASSLNTSFNNLITTTFSFGSALAYSLIFPMYFGIRSYIMTDSQKTMEGVSATIEKNKINRVVMSPTFVYSLIKESWLYKKYDISSLKVLISGGSTISQSVIEIANKTVDFEVYNWYGMTECPYLTDCTTESTNMGAVGKLCGGISARIVDENGNDLPPGQPGELRLKGPTVTKGYYRNPEATRELFDEQGYLKTGDICKIDENMRLYHITRLKELIKYKSTHIYPIQIESILLEHPSVADCAVVGVFQKTEGTEYPRAYVILADGVEETEEVLREIQDYADAKLDEKKRLRGGVVVIKEFPRTGSGKIKRFEFRQSVNREQI